MRRVEGLMSSEATEDRGVSAFLSLLTAMWVPQCSGTLLWRLYPLLVKQMKRIFNSPFWHLAHLPIISDDGDHMDCFVQG